MARSLSVGIEIGAIAKRAHGSEYGSISRASSELVDVGGKEGLVEKGPNAKGRVEQSGSALPGRT